MSNKDAKSINTDSHFTNGFIMGATACKEGRMRTPAADKKAMDYIQANELSEKSPAKALQTTNFLRAWLEGYDSEVAKNIRAMGLI